MSLLESIDISFESPFDRQTYFFEKEINLISSESLSSDIQKNNLPLNNYFNDQNKEEENTQISIQNYVQENPNYLSFNNDYQIKVECPTPQTYFQELKSENTNHSDEDLENQINQSFDEDFLNEFIFQGDKNELFILRNGIKINHHQIQSYLQNLRKLLLNITFKNSLFQDFNNETQIKENLKICRNLLSPLCFFKNHNTVDEKKNEDSPILSTSPNGKTQYECPYCPQKFTQDPNKESGEKRRGRKRKTINTDNENYLDPLSSCKKHISSEHFPIVCLACCCPDELIFESQITIIENELFESKSIEDLYQQRLWFGDEGAEFWVGANSMVSRKKDQGNCTFASRQTFYDHLLTVHFRSMIASKGKRQRIHF